MLGNVNVCVSVCVSPWAGSVLWEVTVNMHKLGCTSVGTGLDLIIIVVVPETKNMTNVAAYVRESPPGCQ